MPRDVLSLDVEIDPTKLLQQTDLAKESIARGLSGGGSGFGGSSAGPGMSAGVGMGAVSPFAPTYMPEGLASTAWQAKFPEGYAPLNVMTDDYAAMLQTSVGQRVSSGVVNTAASTVEIAAGLGGTYYGGMAGAAIGARFGGIGATIGGGVGSIVGGLLSSNTIGTITGAGKEIVEEISDVENTIRQYGYRSGLGKMLGGNELGAFDLSKILIEDAANNDAVKASGENAAALVKKTFTKGVEYNLLGFNNKDDVNPDQIGKAMRDLTESSLEVMRALRVSYDEAIETIGKIKQLGTIDKSRTIGFSGNLGSVTRPGESFITDMMSAGFERGISPDEMMQAAQMGSGMSRASGMFGWSGQSDAVSNTLFLANARTKPLGQSLEEETVQAAGGLGGINQAMLGFTNKVFGPGGLGQALIYSASDKNGDVDVDKFLASIREGKTGDQFSIRQKAMDRRTSLYDGDVDPIQQVMDFNYNLPGIMNRLNAKDINFKRKFVSSLVEKAYDLEKTARPNLKLGRSFATTALMRAFPNVSQAQAMGMAQTMYDEKGNKILDDFNSSQLVQDQREKVKKSRDGLIRSIIGRVNTAKANIRNTLQQQLMEKAITPIREFINNKLSTKPEPESSTIDREKAITAFDQSIIQLENNRLVSAEKRDKAVDAEQKRNAENEVKTFAKVKDEMIELKKAYLDKNTPEKKLNDLETLLKEGIGQMFKKVKAKSDSGGTLDDNDETVIQVRDAIDANLKIARAAPTLGETNSILKKMIDDTNKVAESAGQEVISKQVSDLRAQEANERKTPGEHVVDILKSIDALPTALGAVIKKPESSATVEVQGDGSNKGMAGSAKVFKNMKIGGWW